MDKRSWRVLAAFVLLVAVTSGFLRHHRAHVRLSAPGLKLSSAPSVGEDGSMVGTNSVDFPARVGEFTSESVPVARVVSRSLPKDTVFGHRFYRAPDGFAVDMQAVLMGADRTSLHQPQYCLTGSGWQIDTSEEAVVAVQQPQPHSLPVMKLSLSGRFKDASGATAHRRGVFVYWFVADGRATRDHRQRMWSLAVEQLRTGVLQRWAYVIAFATCEPGAETATTERLAKFIAEAAPQFQRAPVAAAPAP